MSARFHFPQPLPDAGGIHLLPEALAHHAVHTLRMKDGQPIVLFDGAGGDFSGTLAHTGANLWQAKLQARTPVERELPFQIVVVQALASADKMDWIVRKCTELGAAAIVPVRAQRSVLRLEGVRREKRLAHWRQIAIAACEQCGRNRVPEIAPLTTLDEFLAAHAEARKWICAPEENSERLSRQAAPAPGETIYLLVGPEGGWSPDEYTQCRHMHCQPIGLGARILRTETAAIAALAAAAALWGDS
ncbi:MAG: 16S rRNA (uracil(1498)-N(3))-methyltransferase [Rhodocyclaceae bacterium]|nr:16S rRNA (uracil(1498)-N(3))-methyltransferase [Rhodocyclaceae bacterium]